MHENPQIGYEPWTLSCAGLGVSPDGPQFERSYPAMSVDHNYPEVLR
jgi:hypothetical protein